MGTLELRNKIIRQFQIFINDDSKLIALDGVFDSMIETVNTDSLVSEKHYQIVEERRRKHQKGETKGKSWDEVKLELKQKYGF